MESFDSLYWDSALALLFMFRALYVLYVAALQHPTHIMSTVTGLPFLQLRGVFSV